MALIGLALIGCTPTAPLPATQTDPQSAGSGQPEVAAVEGSAQSGDAGKGTEQSVGVKNEWLVGAIGHARIHMKISVKDQVVSGFYYYDNYQINIPLTGTLEQNMKDVATLYLNEDTDANGKVRALYWSEDYIEGFWEGNGKQYPFYVIRKNSDLKAPEEPSEGMIEYAGTWYGAHDYYFGGTSLEMTPLFEDLLYYKVNAYNGAHSGGLEEFAVSGEKGFTSSFLDMTYGENPTAVQFDWILSGDRLNLESNAYDYMCGMGVTFDSDYVRDEIVVSVPTAEEVGIVDDSQRGAAFAALVGDAYETFIAYTSAVAYEELQFDGQSAQGGKSILRGLGGYCYYLMTPEHMYVAAFTGDHIAYYTDDEAYADQLPLPMVDWANNWVADGVDYHYQSR